MKTLNRNASPYYYVTIGMLLAIMALIVAAAFTHPTTDVWMLAAIATAGFFCYLTADMYLTVQKLKSPNKTKQNR